VAFGAPIWRTSARRVRRDAPVPSTCGNESASARLGAPERRSPRRAFRHQNASSRSYERGDARTRVCEASSLGSVRGTRGHDCPVCELSVRAIARIAQVEWPPSRRHAALVPPAPRALDGCAAQAPRPKLVLRCESQNATHEAS
jgi:hypothetical protein